MPFLLWLQSTGLFAAIRASAYAYPALLALHLIALAVFGGAIVVTDLRMLGLGMRSYSLEGIVDGLRGVKRVSFGIAAVCGVLLFGAKAAQYSANPWFWAKMALISLAGANYLALRRGVVVRARLAGGISLLLWAGVAFAGRGPATIKDIMHSMVDPSGDFLFKSVQQIADEHGASEKGPETDAQWDDVRQRLLVLMKAPALLTAEGRMAAHPKDRSKDPEIENEPIEVQRLLDADRPSFLRRARRLHDAAEASMRAADAKDRGALFRSLDGIDKACENCHLHYWYPNDKRAQQAAKDDGLTDQ